MRTTLLITVPGPQEREAAGFTRELQRLQVSADVVSADSQDGSNARELYDITSTPAVLVTRDDGTLVGAWQGSWPRAEDVSYDFHS